MNGELIDDNARVLIGILVERLGGSVSITEAEVVRFTAQPKTYYLEVQDRTMTIAIMEQTVGGFRGRH